MCYTRVLAVQLKVKQPLYLFPAAFVSCSCLKLKDDSFYPHGLGKKCTVFSQLFLYSTLVDFYNCHLQVWETAWEGEADAEGGGGWYRGHGHHGLRGWEDAAGQDSDPWATFQH